MLVIRNGRVIDPAAAYENVKARINTRERPELSSLLRKPLALAAGGLPHAGGHPFERESADWIAMRDWIASEVDGGEGTSPADLTALEQKPVALVRPVAGEVEPYDHPSDGQSIPAERIAHRPQRDVRVKVLGGDLEPASAPLAEGLADAE